MTWAIGELASITTLHHFAPNAKSADLIDVESKGRATSAPGRMCRRSMGRLQTRVKLNSRSSPMKSTGFTARHKSHRPSTPSALRFQRCARAIAARLPRKSRLCYVVSDTVAPPTRVSLRILWRYRARVMAARAIQQSRGYYTAPSTARASGLGNGRPRMGLSARARRPSTSPKRCSIAAWTGITGSECWALFRGTLPTTQSYVVFSCRRERICGTVYQA